jgi:serine/threonine-protein kinase HipA
MRKIEHIILEFFEQHLQATTLEIVEHTALARRTVQKYLKILVEQGDLDAFGEGRGRYYQRVYKNQASLLHLAVLKNEILIAKLSYGDGSYVFEYDKSYKGVELLGLSRVQENVSTTLFPIFENLLPEYERRRRLLAEFRESATILSVLYNVQGDFRFVPYFELFKYKSNLLNRPYWHRVKHKVLGEDSYPNLLDMKLLISDELLEENSNKEHSSLSGYQHKIDIHIDFEKKEIVEAKTDADYLLKPLNRTMINYFERNENRQKSYYPLLALNEHLFMSFAKNELNLATPQSAIILTKEKEFHYVVKRYDRYENYAYGQYDMAQLLNIFSDKKYSTDTISVLKTFVQEVKDETSRVDMLKFQLYASLIQHSDFHAKNMGILDVGKENYVLAPLYDVISVGVYNTEAPDHGLPLSKQQRKFSSYNLDDYLLMAKTLKIGKVKAKETIKQTIEIFLDKFPLYIERTKVFEKEHQLEIQASRIGKKKFSDSLVSMYDRKLIQLKKQGLLQALGLVDKYGGVLRAESKAKE